MPRAKEHLNSVNQISTSTLDAVPSSKMATRSAVKSSTSSGDVPTSQYVNVKRGKGKGKINDSLSSDKQISLTDTIAKSRIDLPHSTSSADQHTDVMPPTPDDDANTGHQLDRLPPTDSKLPPVDESNSVPTFTPPRISDGDLKDLASIARAINSLQDTMTENHLRLERKLDSRLTQIDEQITGINNKLERQDQAFSRLSEAKVDKSKFHGLESTLSDVAYQADEKFADIDTELSDLRLAVSHLKTENLRLSHRLTQAEEYSNVQYIRSKKLNLTIDGLKESDKKENLKSIIAEKVNAEAKSKISQADILSAYRNGKYDKNSKSPRSVSITVKNDQIRNTILRCRGKLPVNENDNSIYINEDLPPAYRRRKSMLRDLVKSAKDQKIAAKIDRGGIRLDGKLYTPDRFSQLPDNVKPHTIRTRQTANGGLAFASEWTPLSNLYPSRFVHQGVLFESSEQCFQYQKALFEEDEESANYILGLTDPVECKKAGASILSSKGWIDACEEVMTDIIRSKFEQNEDIRRVLMNTRDAPLYEATRGEYWGIDSVLNSKAALEESGQGKNRFGLILATLRSELFTRFPDEITWPTDSSETTLEHEETDLTATPV